MLIVQTMSVGQLKRELRIMRGFQPRAKWIEDRISQIENELRAR